MRYPATFLLALALSAVRLVAADAPALPRPLPPVGGDVSGKLTLPKLPGLPSLAWRVQLRPPAITGQNLVFDASATAPGLALRIELIPPHGPVPGRWRLVEGKIELASWWRLAADHAGARAPALPSDLVLAGALTAEGSGEWRDADFSGSLRLDLTNGSAGSAAGGWNVAGLTFGSAVDLAPTRVEVRTAQLRAATMQAAGITARNLVVAAVGAAGGRLTVQRAELAVFGGRISLTPFTLDPVAPAVNSVLDFSGVSLGDLATLVPQALRQAEGQIAGRLSVNWSWQAGIGPGDGSFAVGTGQPVTVRLASSPGLLTGNSPPRIALLPASMGALSRWFSLENPVHGMLQRIELGQAPLAVENLSLQLYPDGAAGARSVKVEVVARTTGVGDVVEKVTFTVNVSGPLDQVLRLGLDDRAKIRLNTAK